MRKNIITILLLVTATIAHAQDKLFLPDSASIAVRKRCPEQSFHDQEMQRLLMPKDAEFGVECVPSFEPEWMLTYSPSAHALIYKVSQENIWYKKYHFDHWDDYSHKPGEKRPKRYKSPKVNTYAKRYRTGHRREYRDSGQPETAHRPPRRHQMELLPRHPSCPIPFHQESARRLHQCPDGSRPRRRLPAHELPH